MASDTRFPRPRFHFTLDNWLNDVIPFFHEGRHHVCFDANPVAPQWTQESVWAHAVSDDLVSWTRLPDALAPGAAGEPDAGGVWTGCIVRRDDGKFAAIYTGVESAPSTPLIQRQCLALSDDLISWERQGAILTNAPPENADCWRDPTVWKDADGVWKMVIGGAHPDGKRGQILLYEADDATLTRWRYVGVLMVGDAALDRWCECPDFFPLPDVAGNEKWFALCSMHKTWFCVGDRTEGGITFAPSAWGATDESEKFYAAKTLLDGKNRRLLFGWIREGNSEAEREEAGWAGVLSLPRVVTLGADNLPRFAPPDELLTLRGAYHSLTAGETATFPRCLEIASDGPFTLSFGETSLDFTPGRLYLDGTVLEHFAADGKICRTERIYDAGASVVVRVGANATVYEIVP